MTAPGIRALLRSSEVARAFWCALPSPYAAELLAASGVEVLVVDRQHGLVAHEAMVGMLQAVRASGVGTLVRVARNDEAAIGEALDAGAGGVIVPMVATAGDAARAVAAARYAPEGNRSYGPARSALVVRGTPAEVNDQVGVVALVETVAGVRAAPEICATPGLDGVMVGWADLALDLGALPGAPSTEVDEAIREVLAAAEAAGVAAVMARRPSIDLTGGPCRIVLVGSDAAMLRAAAERALREP